nr:MAG TPA: hypothetical protein [Caudoviricetes sp.]
MRQEIPASFYSSVCRRRVPDKPGPPKHYLYGESNDLNKEEIICKFVNSMHMVLENL